MKNTLNSWPLWFGIVCAGICILLITGCNGQLSVHSVNATDTPSQVVSKEIDQANAAIAASAQTITAALKAKTLTKVEANNYNDVLKKAAQYIDVAGAALGGGDLTTAEGQLKLANSIITSIAAQLVAVRDKGVK